MKTEDIVECIIKNERDYWREEICLGNWGSDQSIICVLLCVRWNSCAHDEQFRVHHSAKWHHHPKVADKQ